MTIEATVTDRSIGIPESPYETVAPVASDTTVAASAPTSVSPGEVTAAVEQLQAAIGKGPNPDFKLDYLSGLSIVTVRSNLTGEVVFQLPNIRAVELARLIKEGAPISSLGLFNTTA